MAAVLLAVPAGAAEPAPEPRPPSGAGLFYPAEPKRLADMVKRLLASERPRRGEAPAGKILGMLVPHAGLEFTGAAAARAYALLSRDAYDAVIILGAAHRGTFDGAAIYPGPYATPEGSLPYDRRLARALVEADPLFYLDAAAHEGEQAVELQIPFLRRRLGAVPTLGILLSTQDLNDYRRVGEILAKALKGRRPLIVASSDLAQFPSGADADRLDASNLLALSALDPELLWKANRFALARGVPDLKAAFCGEGAVGAMLAAVKALGAADSRVVAHLNSGDVVSERDYNHVVGHASAVFLKSSRKSPDPLLVSEQDGRKLLAAARKALEEVLASGQALPPALSEAPRLNLPGAAAVTLRAPGGAEFGKSADEQEESSLLESVVRHAVAATRQARDGGLEPEAVKLLRLSVTVPPGRPGGRAQDFSE